MITLDEAKNHIRVDINDDDAAITAMIAAAKGYIESYTETTYGDDAPEMVKAAAKLMVADLYENRESQSDRLLSENKTFINLLNLCREMSV
ncbi:head-tail connector protein [Noviherbaspirillum sp.]|jgi:uncharacterized phage protein (predicted DNA packaging)|uniref:head-tail connector protein n=1 Tax=Noviherbaspirillum sp. TaxID=1926288 RepID=UPI0025CC8B1B|nr:head-tail connector protein [Noviherbaspirillum sp.]